MANMNSTIGRMLNWAAAHPQKAATIGGAVVGGAIGVATTQSVSGTLAFAAGGAAIGNIGGGIYGHIQTNKANNIMAKAGETISGIEDGIAKGTVRKEQGQEAIKRTREAAEQDIKKIRKYAAQDRIEKRQQDISKFQSSQKAAIKEARKNGGAPKEKQYVVREKKVLDGTAASKLDSYRADIGGEQVKLGFEDGRRTATIVGGEKDGRTLRMTDEMWNTEVKKAMGGGDDWNVDSILNTAQEIAEVEVGDASGIFEGLGGWIKENPLPAAGIGIAGGLVVSRLLDDD